MTERDWLDGTDPNELLRFLQGTASERKLRLFAVACCRRIWNSIPEQCSRQAVEISERFADGRATEEELEAAFMAADRLESSPPPAARFRTRHAMDASRLAAHPEIRGLADGTASAAAMAAADLRVDFWKVYASEQAQHCIVFRDIFGNPFQSVAFNPLWVDWNDGAVRRMARRIYDDRAFSRLAMLADVLEQAGCDNAAVLAHCRQQAPHVRGCWVVDLALGKE